MGRPAFKPTAKERRVVEEMRYCGEAEETIARSLGICVETLKKHFLEELADGHAKRRREVTGLLFAAARKGNVTAQKRLDEMGRLTAADQEARNRKPAAPAEPKMGKKEAQRRAAESVGGKFAPPAPPKLVVDNR